MALRVWRRVAAEIGHWLRSDWDLAAVARHWDQTSNYDEINDGTYSYFRRFTEGLRLSEMPDGSHVLDFCARTGYGTLYFWQQGKIGSAVCADVSVEMGKICTERLRQHGVQNFRWVHVRDYALPFECGEFDVVLCFETVEHFSRPECLVAELGRVTRYGGTLVLTTPNVAWEPVHALAAITGLHHSEGPHRFIRYRRLLSMVESAGFHVERAETTVLIPSGPRALIRFGEWLEERTRRSLMPFVGLRRVIIARKR